MMRNAISPRLAINIFFKHIERKISRKAAKEAKGAKKIN